MIRFTEIKRRTQSKRILRAAMMSASAVVATIAMQQSALATPTYWDINGATADGSSTTTASGTWDSTTTNWSTDASGSVATQAWVPGTTAVFSAGTGVTGASTITVSGTQTIEGMIFEEGNITLSGGTLALNATSPTHTWNINGAAKTVVVNSTLSGALGTTGLSIKQDSSVSDTITFGGANSGLTGKIFIGAFATGSTVRINVVPTTDTALGASGAGNEIDFLEPATGSGLNSRILLSGGRNINKNITLRGGGNSNGGLGAISSSSGVNTWSGNITLAGAGSSVGTNLAGIGAAAGATLVVTGQIGQSGTKYFGKSEAGTVALWPQGGGFTTNTFAGGTRLGAGTLEVWSDNALGTTTGENLFSSLVYVAGYAGNSPVFALRAPPSGANTAGFRYSGNKQVYLHSVNGGTPATFANYGGANTWAGSVVFGSTASTLALDITSGSLQIQGHLWQNTSTGTRTVDKTGAGELILTGSNDTANGTTSGAPAQQWALLGGALNFTRGQLTLRGNGTFKGGMALNMGVATTLKLDNTSTAINDRILTSTSYPMTASSLQLLGNASASTSQTLDSIGINSGMSEITISQPTSGNGSLTTLTVTNAISRANRSTAILRALDDTTSKMSAGSLSPASMVGGGGSGSLINIVPWLVTNSADNLTGDFVTVGNGSGSGAVRPLTSGEYITLASGNSTYDNTTAVPANNGGSNNITADTTVNAIKVSGGSTVSIDSGKSAYVYSGGLLGVGTSPSLITGGTLTFNQTVADIDILSNPVVAVIPSQHAEGIVTVPTGSTLTIASSIDGADGLTKSGGGTLVLAGTNTFATPSGEGLITGYPAITNGALTVNAGKLAFSDNSNLGYTGAAVYLNGGSLAPIVSNTAPRDIVLQSIGTNAIDVASGVEFSSSGTVSGLALTKTGAGILELTNTANTYTGGTLVSAGYLRLLSSAPTQPQLGNGALQLTGGSIRTDVDMTLDRSVTSSSTNSTGGFYIATGATLTYGASATSTVGMSGSGNYAIDGGGTLVLAHVAGAAMTYTGSLIVNGGSTLLFEQNGAGNALAGIGGTPVNSQQWVVLNNNSRLKFNLTSNAGSNFSGGSRGITVNSTGGIIDVTAGNVVNNHAGIYGSGTITKDGAGQYRLRVANNSFSGKWNVLQGMLEFGEPTNNALSLGTGSGADFITIQDGATLRQTTTSNTGTMGASQGITLAGTTHTIDIAGGTTLNVPGDITAGTGKTLVKAGTGTLSVKNYRGDVLDVSAGTFRMTATSTGTQVSKVVTPTIGGSSKLDLTNNKLVVTGMTAGSWDGSVYDGVTNLVKIGRNGGAWNGNGGIMTSLTAAASPNLQTTLAVASAGDVGKTSFAGVSVSASDALVMYTWNGDANLSGFVDADDYFQIDSNYGKTDNSVIKFVNGDFNYDGLLNSDDYVLIDSGYAAYIASGVPFTPAPDGLSGVSAVPEPGSLALLSLAAMSTLRRRSRRN